MSFYISWALVDIVLKFKVSSDLGNFKVMETSGKWIFVDGVRKSFKHCI